MRHPGGALTVSPVGVQLGLGDKVTRSHLGNEIRLELPDQDYFPAAKPIDFTVTLRNPLISPSPSRNVWTFEAYSHDCK